MASILQDLPLYNSLRQALMKVGTSRSYDDILTLKQYLCKLDFMKNKMSGLHPKQVDDLCVNLVLEEFHYHEVVFNQGDVGDKLYFLLEGEVSCKVKMKIDLGHGVVEQREKVLFTFGPGAHFGERALEQVTSRTAPTHRVACAELTLFSHSPPRTSLEAHQSSASPPPQAASASPSRYTCLSSTTAG